MTLLSDPVLFTNEVLKLKQDPCHHRMNLKGDCVRKITSRIESRKERIVKNSLEKKSRLKENDSLKREYLSKN